MANEPSTLELIAKHDGIIDARLLTQALGDTKDILNTKNRSSETKPSKTKYDSSR